jgi:hypothetical protein
MVVVTSVPVLIPMAAAVVVAVVMPPPLAVGAAAVVPRGTVLLAGPVRL